MSGPDAKTGAPWPGLGPWLWAIFALGVALRITLSLTTDGFDFDMESYRLVSEQINAGLLDFYAVLGGESTRYPYLPGFLPWIGLSREISDATGIEYQLLLGLPMMAADLAIAWLAQDFLARRGATRQTRLAAVALIVFGPPFFSTSGYLPHPDSVAILPAVLAVWLWDRASHARRRALIAGLLVGLGCAIKTTPMAVVFALLPTCRNARERLVLVAAAAAIPVLLSIPFLLSTPRDFIANFGYGGVPGAGGLSLAIQPEMAKNFLIELQDLNRYNLILFENNSIWTLLTFGVLAIFLVRRRTEAVVAASLIWLLFYVAGPAFFFQYLVWGLPFLVMAGHLRQVLAIELAVALPMLLFYNGPWESGGIAVLYAVPMIALWIGLATWLILRLRGEHAAAVREGRLRAAPLPTIVAWSRVQLDRLLASHKPRQRRRAGRWPLAAVFGAMCVFGALSTALILRAAGPDEVFTGADGPFAADQLQYLAWVQDASENVLTDNDYSLEPSSHIYLNPMWAISGVVDQVTGSVKAAFLIWKPIALLVMFGGFWLYARRMLMGGWARVSALAIALFFAAPAGALADWLGFDGARGEGLVGLLGSALNASLLWGYLPAAIAVGLMPLFLLGVEGVVEPERRRRGWSKRRYLLLTCLAGFLASWIHPWQGQALLLILMGAWIWRPSGISRAALVAPAVATLLPLLYYLGLSAGSPAWELAREVNADLPFPGSVVLLGLLPLLVPAALAYAAPVEGIGDRALRIWPFAALTLHFLSPNVPSHDLQAVALPLAVLAVRGWQQLALPRTAITRAAAIVAVVTLTVPGLIVAVDRLSGFINSRAQAHLLTTDEDRALAFVRDDPRPGGVLSTPYLGAAVPGFTGRQVWAGHPVWTPDYGERAASAEELFDGRLDDGEAQGLVTESGAVFLIADCRSEDDELKALLGDLIVDEHIFGCAAVYRVQPSPTEARHTPTKRDPL